MLQHWHLDIDERKVAPVDIEAFRDLVEWYFLDEDHPGMSPPLALGWDMHRTFGADGFPIWRDLMFGWEPPLLASELMPGDQRTAVTTEQYEAALVEDWAEFNREMRQFDQLIIDAMARARENGWEVGGDVEVISTTEAILDDLAKRSGAKRAALEEIDNERDERQWARAEKCYALDDAAYAKWIAAGEPYGRGIKFDRWKHRRLNERRRAALDQLHAMDLKTQRIHVAADSTDAECEAASVEEEKFRAGWHLHNDHLWPELLDAAPTLAPGTPMPPPNLKIVPAEPLPDLIKTSAEFVQGFVPPEYLVDQVLQRRFCYSLTAQTGVGKTTVAMLISAHVAAGRTLGALEVARGTVLYFAGENPTDIQMRWLGLTREMKMDPATADVHFIPGAMPLSTVAARITAEVAAKGLQPALVVVDTAAAYFEGDDENSNTQAVEHARRMRSLTDLPGGPCVLILCHPTKRAAEDDLIPRGGGAFLAEVDGNIALQKRESLVVASAQGKFRGREFSPLSFELDTVFHPILKDVRGRDIPTVIARPVGDGAAAVMETRADHDTEKVLRVVSDTPSAKPTDIARTLGWTCGSKGAPNHMRAKRMLDRLKKEKLVVEHLGRWRTTPTGDKELNGIDRARQSPLPAPPMPRPS